MNQKSPIKRNPAMVSFSKDHHFGLLLTWKIRQGLKNKIAPERISNYVVFFFKADLENHFIAEEKWLFNKLPLDNEFRREAEADHHTIFRLVSAIEKDKNDAALLNQLADLIEKHIRFEERELFNYIQDYLSVDELSNIEQRIPSSNKKLDKAWKDAFWE